MREKIKDIIAWAILICFVAAIVLCFLRIFYLIGEKELGGGLHGILFLFGSSSIVVAVIWAAVRVL